MSDADLAGLVREKLPEVKPPAGILPVDAFRRMTGETDGHRVDYPLQDAGRYVVLRLEPTTSPQGTMLTRAILRTVFSEGNIRQRVGKVGDVVFYKPPRGEQHKARLRITLTPEAKALPDAERLHRYVDVLRAEYDRAQHHINGQAIRRLVRSYLAKVDALHMDGPYFIERIEDAARLREFLSDIGGCRCAYFAVDGRPWHVGQLSDYRRSPQ